VPEGPRVTDDALTWVAVEVLVGEVVVVVELVVVVEPVVVVDPPVVVVDPPVVVVVEEGSVSVPNRTVPMARSPRMSPTATTQVSPAVICAAEGGHWYLAASVVSLPEVVQLGMVDVVVVLPVDVSTHVGVYGVAGGPVTPSTTVKGAGPNTPSFEVALITTLVQLTGM